MNEYKQLMKEFKQSIKTLDIDGNYEDIIKDIDNYLQEETKEVEIPEPVNFEKIINAFNK